MRLTQKKKNQIFDLSVMLVILIVFILIHKNVSNVIKPFVYGLVLAYLLNPVVNYLERKKIKRPIAILLIFIAIFSFLTILFANFIPMLANELSAFVLEIPNIFKFIEEFVEEWRKGEIQFLPSFVTEMIDLDKEISRFSVIMRNSFAGFSSKLLSSTGAILDIVMTPIITFYYLKDKKRILGTFSKLSDRKYYNEIVSIAKQIDVVLGGFIKGQLTVAGFVGVLTGIGCAILGVPYVLTIGFVAGITNIIPYFGPWIGGVLPVLLALMNNPITAVWVTIWIIIVQQIESSFISPQVMAHSVGLHPLTVIFSVLLFGNIFGVIGMIIGVPIAGTIKVLFRVLVDFRTRYRNGEFKKSVDDKLNKTEEGEQKETEESA